MIYVYGIAEQGCVLPAGVTGIDEAPASLVCYQNVSAITSQVQTQRAPVVEANLWRHEKLIEGLMASHAILPVRYGTVLKNEQEMLDVLAANYSEFTANLDHVRGRVELSLRVLWDDPDIAADTEAKPEESSAPPLRGRAYMAARLQEDRIKRASRQRGQAQVDKIDALLAGMATQHTYKTFTTPRMILTAAYLVERERVGRFRDAIQMLASGEPTMQFLCTGPWPPYSFVDVKVKFPGD